NGDLASIILFGSFLLFSISKMVSQSKRAVFVPPPSVKNVLNAATIITGVIIYGGFLSLHRYIAGVPLF
ncbi:MAG: hypothetical protein JKY24_05980, partial [Pseudomonadales bacterium]|nr:hypothetical protein [Pseudomonadales bacterium]